MMPCAVLKGSPGKRIAACPRFQQGCPRSSCRAKGPFQPHWSYLNLPCGESRHVHLACVLLSHSTDQVINNSKYLSGALAERDRPQGGSFDIGVISGLASPDRSMKTQNTSGHQPYSCESRSPILPQRERLPRFKLRILLIGKIKPTIAIRAEVRLIFSPKLSLFNVPRYFSCPT